MLPTLLYKNWGELPLEIYQELREIRRKNWDSETEKSIEEISLFLDISPDDEFFETLSLRDLAILEMRMNWTYKFPDFIPDDKIVMNEEELFFINLNTISLGAYIDCEHYLKQGEENYPKVITCLYRKIQKDQWGNKIIEPYSYDLEERSQWFKRLPVSKIYGAINSYLKWRESLMKSYTNIFEDPNWDKIEGEDQLPPEEVAQIKNEIAHEKKKAPHTWLGIVWELTNHNMAFFDKIFDSPAILVFNTLSMRKALKV